MKIIWLAFCIPFFMMNNQANGQPAANEFEARMHVVGQDSLPYRILYPENFDESRKYPLLLFLHGAGERGRDNQAQLTHGGELFMRDSIREKYPAIVVFPQCPADSYWAQITADRSKQPVEFQFHTDVPPTPAMRSLLHLFDSLRSAPGVNSSRMYVGGLSMGGMGTLELLRRRPNTFAAAISICGGDSPANTRFYQNIPLWLFHGGADPVVPVSWSRSIYQELKEKQAPVRYTEYPGVGHTSWEQAFQEEDLLTWLFSHRHKF